MTINDMLILFPTETLPQGRLENSIGYPIDFQPSGKDIRTMVPEIRS